jgi:hypothetical protein
MSQAWPRATTKDEIAGRDPAAAVGAYCNTPLRERHFQERPFRDLVVWQESTFMRRIAEPQRPTAKSQRPGRDRGDAE